MSWRGGAAAAGGGAPAAELAPLRSLEDKIDLRLLLLTGTQSSSEDRGTTAIELKDVIAPVITLFSVRSLLSRWIGDTPGLRLVGALRNGQEAVDPQAQQATEVTLSSFQSELQPYGAWETDSSYGQVFYPTVQAGWRPYLYGRWVWTNGGWLWVSDESFGWATFHYGRWWWNPYRHAWGWVPGYEWAPAWVVWRYGQASVGWAPLYVGYDTYSDGYPVYYAYAL